MKREIVAGALGLSVTVIVSIFGIWVTLVREPWRAIAEDVERMKSMPGAHSETLNTYGDPFDLMKRDANVIAFVVCPIASIVPGLLCGAVKVQRPWLVLSISYTPVFLIVVAVFRTAPLLILGALFVSSLAAIIAMIVLQRVRSET